MHAVIQNMHHIIVAMALPDAIGHTYIHLAVGSGLG